MHIWIVITFITLIGYITCPPSVTTGSSEGSPSSSTVPSEAIAGDSSAAASAPHPSSTESSPESHRKSSTAAGGQHVPKTDQTRLTKLASKIRRTGEDLKSRFLDSPYGPHLQRFNTAAVQFDNLIQTSATKRWNTLIDDPTKTLQIDQTDRDYVNEVVKTLTELLEASKGIRGVYVANNFSNIRQALPRIRESRSNEEARQLLVTALEKDAKTWTQYFPNPLTIASRFQDQFRAKPPEIRVTSDIPEKQTESDKHEKESEELPPKDDHSAARTEHGDGERSDGKATQARNESRKDADNSAPSNDEKSKEVPKQEPPKTLIAQVIDGFVAIFPIHGIIRLWPFW